jgi:hypothetical protein
MIPSFWTLQPQTFVRYNFIENTGLDETVVKSHKLRIVFWDVLPCKIIVDDVSEVRAASIVRDAHPWTSYSPP